MANKKLGLILCFLLLIGPILSAQTPEQLKKPQPSSLPAILTMTGVVLDLTGIAFFVVADFERQTFEKAYQDYRALPSGTSPDDFDDARSLFQNRYEPYRFYTILASSLFAAGAILSIIGLATGGVDTLVPVPLSKLPSSLVPTVGIGDSP